MSTEIKIVELPRTRDSLRRFLGAGHGVYKDIPQFVAPLAVDQIKVFHDSNPFFEHASMKLWVASRGGRDVGRIAGIIDDLYHKHQDDQAVFFGFFETEDDPGVSQALLNTVMDWARKKGFGRLLGPVNPTTNDECGLLVDGFDHLPAFMMPYNPPYYIRHLEAAGLGTSMNLLAYHIDLTTIPLDRLDRIHNRFQQRQPEITVRPLRKRTFWADLEKIRQVYNDAWQENWGFVPMTGAEIDFMAKRLKPLLVEGLVWIAETKDEPVGFLLAVPDFNKALQPLQGQICSPRILGFLPYLMQWKVPQKARVIVLGVKERYRRKGVESAMLADGLRTGARIGLKDCEASWILEDNHKMRRVIEALGGKVYKTYRLYERQL